VLSTRSVVYAWACGKKGPVYVAMFSPLEIVIALAMGIVFLGDTIYLGRYVHAYIYIARNSVRFLVTNKLLDFDSLCSVIGAAIIAIGFYAVIWGQAQEETMSCEKHGTCSIVSSEAALLLYKSKDTVIA